jgi:hypothetical protein
MTISSTASKVLYGGNGSTATFAIPFMFLRNEDIRVLLTDTEDVEWEQSEGTDYHLTGVGEPSGGTCAMTLPPEPGQTLVIRREPAMVQEVDYVENDAFPAATHEGALDKLTMICQALAEKLDRALTFRVSSAVSGVNLPDPDAGRVLAWNPGGDNLVNKDLAAMGTLPTPVPISHGGTDADNPAEALFNLGFGAAGLTVAGCEEEAEILAAIGAEPANEAILKRDASAMLDKGYPANPKAMATEAPTPATGALQTVDTSGGAVPLAVPVKPGIIRFIITGGNALNPSVDYDSIDGEYDTTAGLAQGEIVSDGTRHMLTIVNGVTA